MNVQYSLCSSLLWKADVIDDSYFFYFNAFQLHLASYVSYKYRSQEEKPKCDEYCKATRTESVTYFVKAERNWF